MPEVTPVYRVVIESFEPEEPMPGDRVSFLVRVDFPSALSYDQEVEVVLALGSTANIVGSRTFIVFSGMSSASCRMYLTFTQAGTYTVYAGARVVRAYTPSPRSVAYDYVWSDPLVIRVGKEEEMPWYERKLLGVPTWAWIVGAGALAGVATVVGVIAAEERRRELMYMAMIAR